MLFDFAHDPGRETAKQAIPGTHVEERPANKGMGGPDRFHDDDLLTPVLDLQADGITDHQEDAESQGTGEN